MLKQTITVSNPYHLSTSKKQLVLKDKETEEEVIRPVEDLGVLILDHPQITISMRLMQELSANNVAVVFSDEKHLPASMLFHLDTHYVQQERFQAQIQAGEPLKKQLWAQVVKAKILNQAAVLAGLKKEDKTPFIQMAKDVKSGDTTHREAKAARFYFSRLFGDDFTRERYGEGPNALLNYGYAIVRGSVARALAGGGLLPTLGIHHHNKYNSFCLADDMMEPFRPFVDRIVAGIWEHEQPEEITTAIKEQLQAVLTTDCLCDKKQSPLMIAMNQLAYSLAQCFEGKRRKLMLPELT